MRTTIWLYLFIFIATFDLHAQFPILTPFALSLGAAPSFIGLMMGLYSITHIPGNLMASVWIDRYGSKIFIVISLIIAGILLLLQAFVTNPWQLLTIRGIAGFILAFLSPAALSMLASLSSNITTQGKHMAGNGVIHTIASVGSPAIGALLVAQLGFTIAFFILGIVLIVAGFCAVIFLANPQNKQKIKRSSELLQPSSPLLAETEGTTKINFPLRVYLIPVALSCAQGILSFEIPLRLQAQQSIMTTGLLFSILSVGSLITLSMLFMTKINPAIRTIYGALLLSILYYILAIDLNFPFIAVLLLIGVIKGIIFPALSHWLIVLSQGSRYGRTFSILSIAFSIGAFLGPMVAGQIREFVSPYLFAFLMLFIAVTINGYPHWKQPKVKPNESLT